MKRLYYLSAALSVIVFSIMTMSCEKMLDIDLKEVLEEDEGYKNTFDARSAALGINGLFQQKMADNYFLMNELRADLLDVTSNADEYLIQISTHQVEPGNPYIRPADYYSVILACNEAMKRINKLHSDSLSTYDNYDVDYSEIAAFRCFIYYQIMQHFSPVIYVTEPLDNTDMVINEKYPRLELDQLVDSLISLLETLPILDLQDYDGIYLGSSGKIDGYSLNRSFVEKRSLLGDLYMWRGDYEMAAEMYRWNSLLNRNVQNKFKCTFSPFGYNVLDEKSDFEWGEMFMTSYQGTSSSTLYNEWFWCAIIDNRFDQSNSIVRYTSSYYGDYLVRPSQQAVNNWNSQFLINGVQGDLRGEGASWEYENGSPVVYKYLMEINSPYQNDADLYLCRTGTIFLRYAEAVNRLGKCKLALAMLNPNGSGLASDPAVVDDNNATFDFFSIQDKDKKRLFALSKGVRGRISVAPNIVPAQASLQDSVLYIENLISQEYALELAFEGDRWMNLLRIANRREKEAAGSGAQFLADAVARKFEAKGDMGTAALVRAKLLNRDNWFLPLE
jgi:hypothetical protein